MARRRTSVLLSQSLVARLEAGYSTQATVVFGAHDDDAANPDRLFVTLPRAQWVDMGEPGTITVTVQPGDHLNHEELGHGFVH